MHELSDDALHGLVVEETGLARDSGPVKLVCACIKHLKVFADFSAPDESETMESPVVPTRPVSATDKAGSANSPQSFGLNLGYTINLNLPATSDPEVFNAIFKSLKEHMLSSTDA